MLYLFKFSLVPSQHSLNIEKYQMKMVKVALLIASSCNSKLWQDLKLQTLSDKNASVLRNWWTWTSLNIFSYFHPVPVLVHKRHESVKSADLLEMHFADKVRQLLQKWKVQTEMWAEWMKVRIVNMWSFILFKLKFCQNLLKSNKPSRESRLNIIHSLSQVFGCST